MLVSDILNRKGSRVEVTHPQTTLAEASRILKDKHIGSLVICDLADKMIGILSERDIVYAVAEQGEEALKMTVDQAMTRKVVSCKPEDNIKQVMTEMTRWHIRHLPVIVGGEPKGVLSIGDVVASRLDEAQLEVDVLRDYARGH